jgi:ABC-type Zn uptake system ZnuABC Zn-binding protein ZnuA
MKVFVYMNLKLKKWSVKAMEGENKGKVIFHSDKITLANCTFKVSEAGRQRVLREKQKNVHAGIVGTLVALDCVETAGTRITYDPYRYDCFVVAETEKPLDSAATIVGYGRKMYSI